MLVCFLESGTGWMIRFVCQREATYSFINAGASFRSNFLSNLFSFGSRGDPAACPLSIVCVTQSVIQSVRHMQLPSN